MTKEELRNEKEKVLGAAFDCKQNNLFGSKDQREYGRKRLKKSFKNLNFHEKK